MAAPNLYDIGKIAETLRALDATPIASTGDPDDFAKACDDVLVMVDYLRRQVLTALDETAERADALDAREQALARREAVLTVKESAVRQILENKPMTAGQVLTPLDTLNARPEPPQPRRGRILSAWLG